MIQLPNEVFRMLQLQIEGDLLGIVQRYAQFRQLR